MRGCGLASGEKEKLLLRISMENLDENSSLLTHFPDTLWLPFSLISV